MSQSLQALAERVAKYRQGHQRARYPKTFWSDVQQMREAYSLAELAEVLHMKITHLRKKLEKFEPQVTFVPVQLQSTSPLSLEFTSSQGRPITLRFCQTDLNFLQSLIPMVAAL